MVFTMYLCLRDKISFSEVDEEAVIHRLQREAAIKATPSQSVSTTGKSMKEQPKLCYDCVMHALIKMNFTCLLFQCFGNKRLKLTFPSSELDKEVIHGMNTRRVVDTVVMSFLHQEMLWYFLCILF